MSAPAITGNGNGRKTGGSTTTTTTAGTTTAAPASTSDTAPTAPTAAPPSTAAPAAPSAPVAGGSPAAEPTSAVPASLPVDPSTWTAPTAAVLAQHTTRTIGSAGDARAVALYAELAAVTTAVAQGFATAAPTPPSPTAPTAMPVPTRQRGSELHLGAAAEAARQTTDLLAGLQSVLDGVHAQAGRDLNRGVVEQLVLKL